MVAKGTARSSAFTNEPREVSGVRDYVSGGWDTTGFRTEGIDTITRWNKILGTATETVSDAPMPSKP